MDLTGAVVANRYTIERVIGRGGMATVWLARDVQHDRVVAIKTLHPELAGAIGIDRFLRELRITARLQHPSVVPVLDSGVIDRPDGTSTPWYAMPYLQGESLRDRLNRERQLPIDEALRVTEAVGSALDAAHRQQIVHRDVKPENICLVGDHVYVVDFGIGKALGATGAEQLTSTGLSIGTPAYMSPEQSVGEAVDARSDQYSLAAVLYEMITGEPPFSGPNAQAIVARRIAEPARSISTVRSTVPEAVERATLRALERAPADRFPSVAEFLGALRKPVSARPAARRRTNLGVAAGIVGAIALVGLVTWGVMATAAGRSRAVDPEVLALYERGVRAYDSRTPEGVAEAVSTLSAAIARDSGHAPSWNGLANAYSRAYQRVFRIPGVPDERLLPLAVTAVNRSLALDSMSADAWVTHAILSRQVDPVDLGPPLRAIRRSIELDSTHAEAWHYFALYQTETGDFDAGLEAWRRGVRLAPAYEQGLAFLALAHYWRGNFDSATVWADSALRVKPSYLLGRQVRGHIAVEEGDVARAEASFEAALRLSTDVEFMNSLASLALAKARGRRRAEARALIARAESLASGLERLPPHLVLYLAHAYTALGDAGAALRTLARYQPLRDVHFQLHLRCDPPFAPLSRDPRFRALVTRPPPVWGKGC
ncbi:MAG TPA: protein kinase [Gemmatimonadaceae bacterium]|nr:protein kinase [Gemmatimonadaceae bacterium]